MPPTYSENLAPLKRSIEDELANLMKLKRLISETTSSLATARIVLDDARRAHADADAQAAVNAVLAAPGGDGKTLARFRTAEERAIEEVQRLQRLSDGLLIKRRQSEARLLDLGAAIEQALVKSVGPMIEEIRADIQRVTRDLAPLLARWFAVYSHNGAALLDHAVQLRIPRAGSMGWILNWPYFFDADGSAVNIPKLASEDPELKALTDGLVEARHLRRRCQSAVDNAHRDGAVGRHSSGEKVA